MPMMGSAGAAPAGPVSTAHSVSFSHPVNRHTVSSTGGQLELQQMTSEKRYLFSRLKGNWMISSFHLLFFLREGNIKEQLMVTSLICS